MRCVNTQDAQAYARWFTKRHGAQLGLRIDNIGLPTELEWEISARGGRYTQQYLWADDASKAETCRHAHTTNCPGDMLPVGGRLKNGYGLDDMIGNVWEWTATDWRDDRKSMEANPRDHGNDSTGVSAARAVRGAFIYYDDFRLRLGRPQQGHSRLPRHQRRFPFGRPDRAMKMARHPLPPLPLYPLQTSLSPLDARASSGGGQGAAAPGWSRQRRSTGAT